MSEFKAGYQGVPGSFSSQALGKLFPTVNAPLCYPEFEDVFAAVASRELDFGVLPLENSSTGAVTAVYDLITRYNLFITDELYLPVRHALLGCDGAALTDIRRVLSHVQAIEQCSSFLLRHPDWEVTHYHNTAVSAKRVSESGDTTLAAIASAETAKLYRLQILADDIQNNRCNTTRFIAIARDATPKPNADKISLCFTLPHESGSLYRLLGHFAEEELNLTKIESRPIPDSPWRYRFFADVTGNPASAEVVRALTRIKGETAEFRILGAYKCRAEKE